MLDDAPHLGRPVEADSDQTETLIENNQHYTLQEVADILKIFKSIKVIGENENCVFYFTEKTKWALSNPAPNPGEVREQLHCVDGKGKGSSVTVCATGAHWPLSQQSFPSEGCSLPREKPGSSGTLKTNCLSGHSARPGSSVKCLSTLHVKNNCYSYTTWLNSIVS